MAQSNIIDVDLSAETPVTELQNSIPDDIFEAALAASQHDSDGEDPYGPQPKRFMQTEHQKTQQKRDLEIRQMAWTLRKMKKDHEAKRQRLKKQKRSPSPFEKLPSELIIKVMQHTHLNDLLDLVNSSETNQSIFEANKNAIYRGIEIEQFSDWKWLFGDTMHRTLTQSQQLKDAITVECVFQFFGAPGQSWHKQLHEILRTIDDKSFTCLQNVMFLQDMQEFVDMDIEATESYTHKKVMRRTAICMRSLTFQRSAILKEEQLTGEGQLVRYLPLPWEARSQVIREQPASIQAEIRSILKDVIIDFYRRLEEVLTRWTHRHYSNPGNHRKPQELKKWMSALVTGHIIEEVIPKWHSNVIHDTLALCFARRSTFLDMTNGLIYLLNEHDQGNWNALQQVKAGVEFGKSIGLDVEGLVDGTSVGDCVDMFFAMATEMFSQE